MGVNRIFISISLLTAVSHRAIIRLEARHDVKVWPTDLSIEYACPNRLIELLFKNT